jgi:glycosyltransferase involved in cell wall biosynthesis
MNKRKLIYIVSDIDKSIQFEWISSFLSGNFFLSFILITRPDSHLEQFLKSKEIEVFHVRPTSEIGLMRAWFSVFKILWRKKPDIVHTHLWTATLIGITTSWLLRIKKRIFTRHHAMIHYNEFPSGRKWDVLCNGLATDIVAISENVQRILIERDKADAKKVIVIHHGFDFAYFQEVDLSIIKNIKIKHSIPSARPTIGVISRYLELKGIQYIIAAFKEVRRNYPAAHLVLANASGNYATQLKTLLAELPSSSYTEITFENNLSSLYKTFDVFVHTPVDPHIEAFGQTYVEALAAGVPSVFTLSGIAPEFIHHEFNAVVVDFRNSQAIASAIERILTDPELRHLLVKNGHVSISRFALKNMLSKLQALYA